MELHVSSEKCMQAYVTACKLMDLHALWNILQTSSILEHSGTFFMQTGTFWNILSIVRRQNFNFADKQRQTEDIGTC